MELYNNKVVRELYKDYPPVYNIYGKQKIEKTIEAATSRILRLFYCKEHTLPNLPGLFIEIEKYKHMLDSEEEVNNLRKICQERISKVLPKLNPVVNVEIDRVKQMISIMVYLEYDQPYYIKFSDAQDMELLKIEINKKPFYR